MAVDIETGLERWKFQTTHLDLWDFDLPSQPSLYDAVDPATGKLVKGLIQPTKRGQLFYLDRETGILLAEVKDVPVRTEGVAEGIGPMSTTQPYSTGMPSVGTEPMTEARMWGATPIDQLFCRIKFRKLNYDGNEFTPPSTDPFLISPGPLGGFNWGAGSVDENRGIFIINDLRFPMVTTAVPKDELPEFTSPTGPHADLAPQKGTAYGLQRAPFSSILGLMCHQPPYGTMTAVDLATRKIVWQRPVGTLADLDFLGLHTGLDIPIGMPSLGGSLVTGSGLIFFGNAMDHDLRVIDSETGADLRRIEMPVGATATAISYIGSDGRQYVVISAGGSSYARASKRGDYVIAYALPKGN